MDSLAASSSQLLQIVSIIMVAKKAVLLIAVSVRKLHFSITYLQLNYVYINHVSYNKST